MSALSLPWLGLDTWPGNIYLPQARPKRKKKGGGTETDRYREGGSKGGKRGEGSREDREIKN